MASITSAQTGLASATSTWVGSVVPVEGDKVTIAAGHTVTLDGTFTWGDDTAASGVSPTAFTGGAIVVNGTLKASRTVNSSLTAKGDLCIGATGTLDYGTEGSPIPSGVTATMLLNKSAAPVSVKYGLITINGSQFYAYGTPRTVNATLTSTANAGATSLTVDNVTGWQSGDRLVLHSTSSTSGDMDERTISGAITGSGPYTVPLSSALTYQHLVSGRVGNFTHNVAFRSFGASTPGYIAQQAATTQAAATRVARYVLFENLGDRNSSVAKWSGWAIFQGTGSSFAANPYSLRDCSFYTLGNTLSHGVTIHYVWKRTTISDLAIAVNTSSNGLYEASGSVVDAYRVVSYRSATFLQTGYSQGGATCRHFDCDFFGANTYTVSGNGLSPEFYRCRMGASNRLISAGGIVGAQFVDCDLGSTFQFASIDGICVSQNEGAVVSATFLNCSVQNTPFVMTLNAGNRFQDSASTSFYLLTNKNADLTNQELYTPSGVTSRDNGIRNRSVSSIRLEPYANAPAGALAREITFPANNGETKRVIGYLRKNASYGSATRPSVTISGLGITPVSFTMTDSTDAWEKFDLSATNSSGINGSFKLTFSAQSANANAACWLDGIYDAPFVMVYRHYGFVFDSGQVARTVDAASVLSESSALALSGLSVDHGTQTLTISGSRSLSEIYDWVHAHLCQTANLAQPEFFTAQGGGNYKCTYNVVLTGAITGAGALSMPGNTLTVTGGTSTVPITHNAGTFASVSVTGYTVGARLQIYNVSTAAELYNDIPSGSTLSVNVAHTTNQTIRVRMARVVGLDADQLIETAGLLTSAGASLLLSPRADAVYEGNAIDGTAVTEFAADFPNVQIDIDDPDGVTTPQRGYAWYMAGQMTAQGIAAFHGGMVADDALNYMIVSSILDMRVQNVSATPCVIAGGRLYREDGTSIFAAGVGPIQADPGKAYTASGASAATVAAAVRTELTTELGRLDVAVGSRLASAGYTAPDNAALTAIKAKTDNLPADPASNTQVNTRLATAGYTAAPAASVVAAAVRTELATELGRVDADVSSRLAAASYVAPDNAALTAIKAKTDNLPADPASNTQVNTRLATAGYTAAPAASAVAAAVRTELATELGRVDAVVSSRLAAASYVAPDNAALTAIKAKTDNLPADPASAGSLPSAAETAGAVWSHPFVSRLLTVAKFLGLK